MTDIVSKGPLVKTLGLTTRQQIERLRSLLDTERTGFFSLWQQLADYIAPRAFRKDLSDVNKGDRRHSKIYNGTATMAAQILQSGMHGGMTSPSREWFRLTMADQELAESDEVKVWLADVTRRMRSAMARSNVYRAFPFLYHGAGVFATSAIFLEEVLDGSVVHVTPMTMGTYWLSNDHRGRVNVFIREFTMTVRGIITKFNPEEEINWDRFSTHIRNLFENGQTEQMINVIHAVLPNEDYDPSRPLDPKRGKPFKSVYYEKGVGKKVGLQEVEAGPDANKLLRENGYEFFPVLVFRWNVQSQEDAYGTGCPGITALGDIKQLQTGERKSLQAIEKSIHPPLKAPPEMRAQKVSLLPGDVSYSNERDGGGKLEPIYQITPPIHHMENKQRQVEERIQEAFMVDMFLMLARRDRPQMTATEVAELQEEKRVMVGPALEQLNEYVLDPFIDIFFHFMEEQGMIPDPPEEIAGRPLRVEYISVMAQAQKLIARGGVDSLMQFVLNMSQMKQDIVDKIDFDQLIEEYADITGVSPKLLREDERVQEIRRAREQQEAQRALMENARGLAGSVKDLGTTPAPAGEGEQTVLSRMGDAAAEAEAA
jgi:hypothetical protein